MDMTWVVSTLYKGLGLAVLSTWVLFTGVLSNKFHCFFFILGFCHEGVQGLPREPRHEPASRRVHYRSLPRRNDIFFLLRLTSLFPL